MMIQGYSKNNKSHTIKTLSKYIGMDVYCSDMYEKGILTGIFIGDKEYISILSSVVTPVISFDRNDFEFIYPILKESNELSDDDFKYCYLDDHLDIYGVKKNEISACFESNNANHCGSLNPETYRRLLERGYGAVPAEITWSDEEYRVYCRHISIHDNFPCATLHSVSEIMACRGGGNKQRRL